MIALRDSTVLVLGLGASGLAMAVWCARAGARVRVWDSRGQAAPQAAALAQKLPDAQWLDMHAPGAPDTDVLQGVSRVLKSPGLSPSNPLVAPLLVQAERAGLRVEGELDLFVEALAQLRDERGYAPQVLAITGTNGKTTTASLTALLVARTGRRVALAGNIGPTMLQTLAQALDLEPEAVPQKAADVAPPVTACEDDGDEAVAAEGLEPPLNIDDDTPIALVLPDPVPPPPVFQYLPDVWVLELSSFQLAFVQGFEPSAAVVLNITEDHLDWHGNLEAYQAAKARVWGERAVVVMNRDDAKVRALLPPPTTLKTPKGRPARVLPRTVVSFGLNAPQQSGDYGLVEDNGMAWLVRARVAEEPAKRSRVAAAIASPEDLQIQRLMPADALRIRGRHNVANALAALALAGAIDCPLAPLLHGLREYSGEPHRVEHVATWRGVDVFDDSKGTNVGATVAALQGLGTDRVAAQLVVILGGDGKGQDFSPLAEPVRRHVRAVATLGRDAALIEQALSDTGVPLRRHATLQAATRWCFEQAHAGDAVLLSPACASLDMFRDYAHRAEVFVAEVQALVADAGGVLA